jgi:hypothetical protein
MAIVGWLTGFVISLAITAIIIYLATDLFWTEEPRKKDG